MMMIAASFITALVRVSFIFFMGYPSPQANSARGFVSTGLEQPMLLPDLQVLPPEDLLLLSSPGGTKKLIRFSNSVANFGPGAAELLGEYDEEMDIVQISQVIHAVDGTPNTHEVGEFSFHREHNHWHWDDFGLYEVWTVSLDGELRNLISSSGKVGYCLRDDRPLQGSALIPNPRLATRTGERAVFLGCGWQRQGISVGWMDTYSRNTPGQYVDISAAPDGLYALRSIVDPKNRMLELDESNNTAILFFTLQGHKLKVIGTSITPLPEGNISSICHLLIGRASIKCIK